MKIETKHILIAILLVFISAFGYYFFVYRPQEIRLRCMEVAKDYEQQDVEYRGKYAPLARGYFINRSMYNNCLDEAGLGNKNNEQE